MIRPVLLEAPKPPRQGLPARARAFFTARWPGRMLAVAIGLRPIDLLLSFAGFGLPGFLTVPSAVVLWLFLAWLVWRGLRWLADRLLWRIRTKLIVSYTLARRMRYARAGHNPMIQLQARTGLSEAMNPASELFGESRLRRILEESASLGSEELRERILEEVRRFVGDALPHDDMMLVVLKVVPEERAA